MNPRLTALIDKIETMTLRERAMILIGVLGLCIVLWDFSIHTPATNTIKALTTTNNDLTNQIGDLATQRVDLLEHPPLDPNVKLKDSLASTTQKIAEIDAQLHSATTDLVSSQRMVEVLRALVSNQGLELISVKSLPIIPIGNQSLIEASATEKKPSPAEMEKDEIKKADTIVADAIDRAMGRNKNGEPNSAKTEEANTAEKAPKPTLFRHGLEMQMRGSFAAILSYLHATENLPWRLYWDALEYKVEAYPNAKIVLRVYTLSVDEGWIGV